MPDALKKVTYCTLCFDTSHPLPEPGSVAVLMGQYGTCANTYNVPLFGANKNRCRENRAIDESLRLTDW